METIFFVAKEIYPELKVELEKNGKVMTIPTIKTVYEAIENHPDIGLCSCSDVKGKEHLFIIEELYDNIRQQLAQKLGEKWLEEKKEYIHKVNVKLGSKYPKTIPMNGKIVGHYFLHNTKYTAPEVLRFIEQNNYVKINVKQGYTGCSVIAVGENAILTADQGIIKRVKKETQLDTALVSQKEVELKGFSHGFIGGIAGSSLKSNKIWINGDVSLHSQKEEIRDFIKKHNIEYYDVKNKSLKDIGGILVWNV